MRTEQRAAGRYYIVDEVTGLAYPSVTTILGGMSPKEGLVAWRQSVGDEQADAIMRRAADRGTFMHAMHEHTLDMRFTQGRSDNVLPDALRAATADCSTLPPEALEVGKRLFFNFHATDFYDRIGRVVAQEQAVWSTLGGGYAGRLDLLIESRDGRLVLVDFKSSTRPKRREWVLNYELQAAAYCAAYKDRTGLFPDGAEVWISCETGEVQEFVLSRQELLDRLREFHRLTQMFHTKYHADQRKEP